MKKTALRPISAKQKKELAMRTKLKKELLIESGGLCMTCGTTGYPFGLSLSHTVALSRGGKTERGNVNLLCYPCHDKIEKKAKK